MNTTKCFAIISKALFIRIIAVQTADYTLKRKDEGYKDKRTYQAREYLLSIMRFWLEKGCDGFRVDMADSLVKNDEGHQATIEVWNYLFKKIRKEFPDAFFVSVLSRTVFCGGF